MDINQRREWMDNRNFPGRRGMRPEFATGVAEFLDKVRTTDDFIQYGKTKCPCLKCECVAVQDLTSVELHLYKRGFMPDYYIWANHGETWDLRDRIQFIERIHGGRSSPTPEFLKKSEQRKKARASEKGGSLHTGGSVSAATQKMRLEKKEKRAIPVTEMHKIRHIKKDKKSGEVWVEPRAKKTWEKSTQAVAVWVSSQPSDCGSNTPAPLTMQEETRIWLEVNGGVKKGSAYGPGTLYASDKHPSNYMGATSSAPSSSANPKEMATIKEQLAVLTRQNEAQQKQMQEMIQMLLSRKDKSRKKSKGKRKSKRRHSESSESSSESSE